MSTIIGLAVGYWLGSDRDMKGGSYASVKESWEVIRTSEEVRDMWTGGIAMFGDLLDRGRGVVSERFERSDADQPPPRLQLVESNSPALAPSVPRTTVADVKPVPTRLPKLRPPKGPTAATPSTSGTKAKANPKPKPKAKAPAKARATATKARAVTKKAPVKKKATAKKKAPVKAAVTKRAPANKKAPAKKRTPAKKKATAKKAAPAKRAVTRAVSTRRPAKPKRIVRTIHSADRGAPARPAEPAPAAVRAVPHRRPVVVHRRRPLEDPRRD